MWNRSALALLASASMVATSGAAVAASSGTAAAATQGTKPANVRHAHVSGQAVASGGEIHGIALTQANRPFLSNVASIPQLSADGINTVDLYITEYTANPYANTIYDGTYTPPVNTVKAVVNLAHSYGLAVELMPVVWTAGNYAPRTEYRPGNLKQWFASYRAMITKWAQVAADTNTEIFCAGSEYSKLQQRTTMWRRVFTAVRAVDPTSQLTYMTPIGAPPPHFWRSLDMIGISPYYSLSSADVPTVAQLQAAWRPHLRDLRRLAQRYHRPILFDELGYQSQVQAAMTPWQTRSEAPSETAQANAYQAAINVTHHKSWLRGVVFFTWGPPVVGPVDSSYEPVGKLAECAMAKSWASRSTPTVNGLLPACLTALQTS